MRGLNDCCVTLRDIRFWNVTESECAEYIATGASRGGWVVTVNTDTLRRYDRNPQFRELVAPAATFVADGMPLVWAARMQGTPLSGRVAGSSLLYSVCAVAAAEGKSVFLLGGNPGSADGAAERLKGLYPRLEIAGTLCPPRGFMASASELTTIERALRESSPDIIFVGLPCPLQESLISEYAHELPRAWWLGIGVSFSFASGEIERAPGWMQRTSLEWLHRLSREPRRLASRYLRDDLPYALSLLASAVVERLSRW